MQVTRDLRELIVTFEQHYGVPPLPYDAVQWEQWLNRHEPFATMCCRCVEERGLEPSPLPFASQVASQDASRPVSRQQRSSALGSARSDSSDEPTAFPGLVDVDVTQASREMILYWAMVARRRVRERRNAVDLQAVQEESDAEPDSESLSLLGHREFR